MSEFLNFFNRVGDTIGNIIDYHLNGNTEGVMFNDYNILRKPIGVGSKSYGFMEAMIHRNIGNNQHTYDGYGTIIGRYCNPYLNLETNPWFVLDESRQKYNNYLSYVNSMYYHGTMLPPNFNHDSHKMNLLDYNLLKTENSRVGAIHHYNVDNVLGARLLIPNGATNPNGYEDTRLGVINNFYLSSNLYDSYEKLASKTTSSYHKPSYGYDENVIPGSFSITQGAYSKFGFTGEYGMNSGKYYARSGMVLPQSYLTNDIIMWSTVDSNYGGSNNVLRLKNIIGEDGNINEESISSLNSPFGNYYDLTYSLGLLSASGEKTKEFIAKSIYGIDLLSDYIPPLEYKELNFNTLKKISRKKYFASIGSRGTNYIDEMTNGEIIYESTANSDTEKIRIHFENVGNDNFSNYITYLTYQEAEKHKEAPFFTSSESNSGTKVRRYESYSSDIIKNKKDIINYTNEQFKKNKYKTIIGRFHTDSYDNPLDAKRNKDNTSTAVSQYGMSHGRNLLKRDHKNSVTNLYHDPYCRVWTYHKQYSKYSDLIRPFNSDNSDILDGSLSKTYQPNRKLLKQYGSKNSKSGLVNIFPEVDNENNIYKCMFSIENLAWKDNIEKDDKLRGPLGGKIMWFPPYGLTFSEQVNTNWNSTQFIGRGEKIYSYTDTERGGNLSFLLLIDYPSLINAASKISDDKNSDVDDVDSIEQQILRFFAGCEIPAEDELPKVNKEPKKEEPQEIPILTSTTIVNKTISFNVYFPNNYSGVDDTPKQAIEYLLNGVGPNLNETYTKYYSDNNRTNLICGYEQDHDYGVSYINNWDKPQSNLVTLYKDDGKTEINIKSNESLRKDGTKNYWGYRVDKAYSNQVLENSNQYLDTKSYGLNSIVNNVNSSNDGVNCSLLDIAMALNSKFVGEYETQYSLAKILKSLLSEYNVDKIEMCGYSTSHGKQNLNVTLAKNRAKTIQGWLKESLKLEDGKFEQIKIEDNQKVKNSDINDKTAKENRCVKVIIRLSKEEVVADISNVNTNISANNLLDSVVKFNQNFFNNISFSNLDKKINQAKKDSNNILGSVTQLISDFKNKKKEMEEQMASKLIFGVKKGTKFNEFDFFKHINSSDSILRNKIIDKIKFFDPAFHSITPEGFNSRLTFLHQCTRQGPTNSSSDTGGRNIRNLSFGAPPICVLRIGDFYNTKIIIDSLNITYEESTWDLNDEGIGVMPMIAKIDIGFKFIGGSDLSGPIAQLQNAVSFNYYANTSVYDNNAVKKIIKNDNEK